MTPEQSDYIDNLSSGNIEVARRGQLVVNAQWCAREGAYAYGDKRVPIGLELSMISVAVVDAVDFYLKNER